MGTYTYKNQLRKVSPMHEMLPKKISSERLDAHAQFFDIPIVKAVDDFRRRGYSVELSQAYKDAKAQERAINDTSEDRSALRAMQSALYANAKLL